MSMYLSDDMVADRSLQERQATLETPFPGYVRGALETRYENVFCTLARVGDGVGAAPAEVYADLEGGMPETLVLYRRGPNAIQVLNEMFTIGSAQLERMARHLFARYPEVGLIHAPSVAPDDAGIAFPVQRFNATEDIVVTLPSTPEHYLSSLGRNTRTAIRRAQKLLASGESPLEFMFCEKGGVGREGIARLIELNRLRLEGKHQVSRHNQKTLAELERVTEAYGFTLLARAGGEICGGVICSQVGTQVYMHVIAHARAFDDARLGMYCCYLSICEAIRRGARDYHLLSGRYAYKFRLLGKCREFDRIVIYRSRTALLSNLGTYTKTLARGKGRLAKRQLTSWREKWKQRSAGRP